MVFFECILADKIFRFDSTTESRKEAFPSASFKNGYNRETPIKTDRRPDFIPTFDCFSGNQSVKVELPIGTTFYGTGVAAGQLERTGKRVITWNTDAWSYGAETLSLYQSHPWVLAVLPNGESLGVLADTTRRCEIDLREANIIQFTAPSSFPVITFGLFDSPAAVLTSLSQAIGTLFMPPKWSLGYHQSRWSYDSDKKVLEIAKNFREKDIPCDVIWMDIDYMDGFRCFTFDKERFPNPKSLVENIHKDGFKAIWILETAVKQEEGYFIYDSGSKSDLWVLKPDGEPFIGDVWPGPSVFPDFTRSKVRSWWADLVRSFISNGVDGIWNDMNEPALFKTLSKTMPESNIHRGDDELGGVQHHSHYHNVYGTLMARATYEGMKLANENKRPFVLSRAGYIGGQRYAATWTGDNLSNWDHLKMSIPMVLQLGLSGQPFSGPDVGGYEGSATPNLFGRWMGIGAMLPFCRGHSETDAKDHEPWSFGQECEDVCRRALKRRYRLLPHLYTLFYMTHTTGVPVATPIFFADPKDPKLRTVETSFLLGPLLVIASTCPQSSQHGSYSLPHVLLKGIWLLFDLDEDAHPDLPTLFLQGGSIIPLAPPHQHVGAANMADDLTLVVALDEHGQAKGTLFEDEGDGYEYQRGGYLLTHYSAQYFQATSSVTIRVDREDGLWKRPKRGLHILVLLGGCAMVDAWGLDGEDVHITMPHTNEVPNLASESEQKYRERLERCTPIPTIVVEETSLSNKRIDLLRSPIEIKAGNWILKVVPWVGGKIISMEHLPSGTQWLNGGTGGYKEMTGREDNSPGGNEDYTIIGQKNELENEFLSLEGDVGGGIFLRRHISIDEENGNVILIQSIFVAPRVDAGSVGFSRLVVLRAHPVFTLLHPAESFVSFTSMNGSNHRFRPEPQICNIFEGDLRPNGEWMLCDQHLGVALINRFDAHEVYRCIIRWGLDTVALELWTDARPISKETPLKLFHQYEVTMPDVNPSGLENE